MSDLEPISKDVSPNPAIAPSTAVLLVLFFTLLYVAPFYLSESLRISSRRTRNDPISIRARTRSVYLTCILTTCITLYVLIVVGHVPIRDVPVLLGLRPLDIPSTLRVQSLVAILFAAPLFEHIIVDSSWRAWSWCHVRRSVWTDWCGFRNLIVGPVSEEYIFRAQAMALFLLAGTPAARIVYLAPTIFGLAHIHHFNEAIISCKRDGQTYLTALRTPGILVPALIRTVVQFAYTSLFGAFETFVLLRTGNIYVCVLTHTFCNWLGLPRFWGRVGSAELQSRPVSASRKPTAEHHDECKQVSADGPLDPGPTVAPASASSSSSQGLGSGVRWTVAYYVLLSGGLIAFTKLLWPLTESENALAVF